MAFTSRYERIFFCEKIEKISKKGSGGSNMFSESFSSETVFSFSVVNYQKLPTIEEEKMNINQRLMLVWCRINYSNVFSPIRHKIKRATVIISQNFNGKSKLSFVSSTKLNIPKDMCNNICDLD